MGEQVITAKIGGYIYVNTYCEILLQDTFILLFLFLILIYLRYCLSDTFWNISVLSD